MNKWLIHVIPRQSLPAQLQREQAKYTQYTVDFSKVEIYIKHLLF